MNLSAYLCEQTPPNSTSQWQDSTPVSLSSPCPQNYCSVLAQGLCFHKWYSSFQPHFIFFSYNFTKFVRLQKIQQGISHFFSSQQHTSGSDYLDSVKLVLPTWTLKFLERQEKMFSGSNLTYSKDIMVSSQDFISRW